jgi:hypothetical protein
MKGFTLLAAALVGAGLLYASTATGSQEATSAGPTKAQFNALKKQVATLRKDVNDIFVFVGLCFKNGGVPTSRVDGYVTQRSDGSTTTRTALDVSGTGETPAVYLLDLGKACSDAIKSLPPAVRFAIVHQSEAQH